MYHGNDLNLEDEVLSWKIIGVIKIRNLDACILVDEKKDCVILLDQIKI